MQDGKTGIEIPKDYVIGRNGAPRPEFFLMISTGDEDNQFQFLLTAEEIVEDFRATGKEYRVQANKIITNGNRQISLQSHALDKIDRSLSSIDLSSNYSYIAHHGYLPADTSAIEPELGTFLFNHYGNLSEEYQKLRDNASKLLVDAQTITDALSRMVHTTDPEEFFSIREESLSYYTDGYDQIIVGNDQDLWEEELLHATQDTREYLERLSTKGFLTAFPALLQNVLYEIETCIRTAQAKVSPPAVHIDLKYVESSLDVSQLSVRAESDQCEGQALIREGVRMGREDSSATVLNNSGGEIEVCVSIPSRYMEEKSLEKTRKNPAKYVLRVIQILLHKQVFEDDDGLI